MGTKSAIIDKSLLGHPGPGEYEPPLVSPGPAALIGTGQRSDLGIGKSFLGPGVGQYNISGRLDGPKSKFGHQKKVTSIEKTYEPGPGSYYLPNTIGNIPKYMLLASKAATNRSRSTG